MQHFLDRRQPSARLRPQLREIPLQRRCGTAGAGENNVQWTSRDDRSGPVASRVIKARDLPPRAFDERRTGDPLPSGGDLPVAAPPAALLEAVGAPEEALEVFVDQAVVEVPADQLPDVQPADGDLAEDGQLPAGGPAAGDLVSGDLPMVSDQVWEWMESLLPSSMSRRGGRWRDHRQVVEAICWKYRTGSPWRELPARFGPWQTAYQRSARWSSDGTWARLLSRAQTDADASGELDWLVAVASAVVRMHQHGAGGRPVGDEAATTSPDVPKDEAAA
jgi:putative transposase